MTGELGPLPGLTQIISGSWGSSLYATTQSGEFATITLDREPAWIRRTALPAPILNLAVSAGSQCVLLNDGTVWCGGGNGEYGCLGRPQAETYSREFEAIPELTNIAEIAGMPGNHPCAYCARNASDHVWCWGANFQEAPIQKAVDRMAWNANVPLISYTPRRIEGLPGPE